MYCRRGGDVGLKLREGGVNEVSLKRLLSKKGCIVAGGDRRV